MTKDEIKFWVTELRRRGWGTRLLGRTLGLANEAAVERKFINGREWLYHREQIRASRQLRRIISGELVCVKGRPGRPDRHGNGPGKAVLAAHPVPLVPPTKRVLDVPVLFKYGVARFKQVPAYEPPELRLPDFEALRKVLDGF